jgi:hypothetical protein
LVVCGAVLAIAALSHGAAAQRPVQSTQEILMQLERDWVAALQRNDADFVDKVLAPEFVSTYGDGSRGDRVRELQLVKEFNQQVDSWTVDEFTVRFAAGGGAANTYRWRVEATGGSQPVSPEWTEVIPWTETGGGENSTRRMVLATQGQRLRLTAERVGSDEPIQLSEGGHWLP